MTSPSPAYLAESRATALMVNASFCIPIVVLSTSLRLWSELYLQRNRLKVDDVLIILASITSVGFNATWLHATHSGLGRHTKTMQQEHFIPLGKLIIDTMQLYIISNACNKLFVLALYHRAFPAPTFQRITLATAIVVTIWFVATELTWTLQCILISRFWKGAGDQSCSAIAPVLYYQDSSNFAHDVWIFGLPLPQIRRMRMIERRKKVGLAVLFSVGAGGRRPLRHNLKLGARGHPPLRKPPPHLQAQSPPGSGASHAKIKAAHRIRRDAGRVLRLKRVMNLNVNAAYSIWLEVETALGSRAQLTAGGGSMQTGTGTGTGTGSGTLSSEPEIELKNAGRVLVERRSEHIGATAEGAAAPGEDHLEGLHGRKRPRA
ncbi:hypothetical protein BDW74DRAFT_183690 [Aspergillus multicolor]|uniref:uncharacterized protein n=1 Tax=Aspergillus multicolor TaxID=41759 RepID=UPI003CCE2478